MPPKIRDLKKSLAKAGFVKISTKGSHTKWKHPSLSVVLILSGKDGKDAKHYQEKQVVEALKILKKNQKKE
ncbi:type II toxin-antitoxin system HicA family toxin [Baaleninema simplex]|uniref:type II toxin-antitoxin system HicA family toxin n=1 Tax=Baaleninema simplex TaxID=2862350 RepID=UPI000363A527|nr:type II toxin-antitoxin system HicA family toxin [Baaleninema simplex]